MKQYMDVLEEILELGTWQENRTGVASIKLPYPAVTRFHMDNGFPALTGRRAPFKSAMAELVGFIRGVTSAFDFRGLGCKFWDQNANENAQWLANPFRKGEDDLGDVYGAQWRRWPAYKQIEQDTERGAKLIEQLNATGWTHLSSDLRRDGRVGVWFKEIDQLADCVRKIILNPSDRRILFHAWNPAKLDEIALPACHLLYQFVPSPATKELALSLTIR
jgi:thymidylate synthase